ncbi:hypothetical protein IB244_17165 [Rhizobium sp. RHZ02]|uniref:hypothetical protein n=1 Tax=Rhizobium sp. RHZ02 TaxID=2769306 RepID=UPI001780E555|nr:hypothetical protein [Rhizobium sp. RHZ02]MBD9453275.1 hypothetical protein [Rhizobium sp. RHZ02]
MQPTFGAMKVIESEAALVPPKKAISDDMRLMVDILDRLGEVRMNPGCYRIGADTMVVHPVLYAQLRRRLSNSIDKMAMDVFYGRGL